MEAVFESLRIILSETMEIYNRSTWSGRLFLPFALIALLLLIAERREDRRVRLWIVLPSALLLLVLLNPVLMHYVYKSQMFERTIRFYWALPFSLLLVYGFVELQALLRPLWKKAAVLLSALMLLFCMCSARPTQSQYIDRSENVMKVPQVTVEFSEVFHRYGGAEPTAALPVYISKYMRIYDASIRMPYGYWSTDAFHNEMASDTPDLDLIGGQYAPATGCDFVVLQDGTAYVGSLESWGYVPVDTLHSPYGSFTVYFHSEAVA